MTVHFELDDLLCSRSLAFTLLEVKIYTTGDDVEKKRQILELLREGGWG